MKRYTFVSIMLVALLGAQGAVAGGIHLGKTALRLPIPPASRSGVRALIKQQHLTHVTSTALLRKTVTAARRDFTGPRSLLQRTRHSVVQIAMPNHSTTLGTGFVFKENGRVWVAMPFHLGGSAGNTRVIRLRKLDGTIAEQEVKIALNGTAGWHSPDISLAEIPAAWRKEVRPLQIAQADVTRDVYSVGYIAGELELGEVLPISSRFTHVDQQNMLRDFYIPGSTMENPVSGNGYCGTPLFQKIDGDWKVVGMHNGHVLDLKNPQASVGSSVNLAATLARLIDNYFKPMAMGHGLEFRGWEITRLGEQERVDTITVIPADAAKTPIVRSMRNFPLPYSDSNVEQAVGDLDLQPGDKLVFSIKGRTETQRHVDREVEFIIP